MQATSVLCGHFQADGDAHNLSLGFTPSIFEVWNANAAAGEDGHIIHFFDDGNEFHTKMIADNGSTGNTNHNYRSSSQIISSYAGTSSAAKGVTIGASFMDDNDEIYWRAFKADKDTDAGDIA